MSCDTLGTLHPSTVYANGPPALTLIEQSFRTTHEHSPFDTNHLPASKAGNLQDKGGRGRTLNHLSFEDIPPCLQ